LCVKVPTKGASTGMIRPIDIMSISTAIMMKAMPGALPGVEPESWGALTTSYSER